MKKFDAEKTPDPHKIGAKKPSELKLGEAVRFHRILPKREGFEPIDTKIASEAWQLGGGDWVVKIEGQVAGVSTQFLEPLP